MAKIYFCSIYENLHFYTFYKNHFYIFLIFISLSFAISLIFQQIQLIKMQKNNKNVKSNFLISLFFLIS